MHIDVHCHMFPDEYLDLVEKEGGKYGAVIHTGDDGEKHCILKGVRQPPLKPFMDTGVRLGTMDEMGLDMNVLSFSSRPGVYWADAGLAEELSREANNGYARMIKERPEKFSGLATLPAQDGERSARELERAVNELGLKGGFMGTNVNGRYMDDEGFMPIYEAAAALKVPIIVHPANPAAMNEMRDYHLHNLIGFTTESANSIARLIFSGVFDRLPDLQFIFLHGGGTAPILIGRFIHGWKVRPECKNIARSPLEYMRGHFFFDALVFHPPVVRFLVDLMGSERVMLGTDLPYDMTDENIVETIRSAGLSEEEYANVTHRNAQKLFHL
ncbi:MAG: amidohydrolase family protein [bacterium]